MLFCLLYKIVYVYKVKMLIKYYWVIVNIYGYNVIDVIYNVDKINIF